jgi:hypothetical protein
MAPEFDHGFIARPFALGNKLRANPPDERMKPEDRLDKHVQGRCKVIATPHVAEFVRDHGFEMSVIQVLGDRARPQENWAKDPEDSRLERHFGLHQPDRNGRLLKVLQAPKR